MYSFVQKMRERTADPYLELQHKYFAFKVSNLLKISKSVCQVMTIGDYIVLGCPVPEEVASQIRFLRKSSNWSNSE